MCYFDAPLNVLLYKMHLILFDVITTVPLQNVVGPMKINCYALKEMAVFAEITVVVTLSTSPPKAVHTVQITSSRYACCAGFSSFNMSHFDERA